MFLKRQQRIESDNQEPLILDTSENRRDNYKSKLFFDKEFRDVRPTKVYKNAKGYLTTYLATNS